MFTGIIEEIGTISHISTNGGSGQISIHAHKVLEGTKLGDSIAVNGVCLTVTSMSENGFCADVMAETVRKSSLGILKSGDSVNLERAMAANGRFGGHIVSGHIDGTGTICQFKKEQNAVWITIEASPEILHLIVHKGSICIDGVSLTVAEAALGMAGSKKLVVAGGVAANSHLRASLEAMCKKHGVEFFVPPCRSAATTPQ